MTPHLSESLSALNAALTARRMYDAGHPAAAAALERCVVEFNTLVHGQEKVTLVHAGEHVLSHGYIVAGSAAVCQRDGVFDLIARAGFRCLTLRAGIAADEVSRLLAFLLDGHSERAEWRSSHMELGNLAEGSEVGPPRRSRPIVEQRQAVENLWREAGAGRNIDIAALAQSAQQLSLVATADRGTVIPMASLKSHDEYTFVHTINVAILSGALAEAIGLSRDRVHDVISGAMLHDIGKQKIPIEILNKSGKLTDQERALMQRHPVDGALIAYNTPGLTDAAPIIALEHHIHLDGSGYPKLGPKWRPHLISRVVQVADVFDALATHRPYRAAMTFEQCWEIMSKDAGRLFERDLVDVFFSCVALRAEREDIESGALVTAA